MVRYTRLRESASLYIIIKRYLAPTHLQKEVLGANALAKQMFGANALAKISTWRERTCKQILRVSALATKKTLWASALAKN